MPRPFSAARRVLGFAACLALATFANAQTADAIQGRVVDALGEPIPAAEVWVDGESGDLARTWTDGQGWFVMPIDRQALPAGASAASVCVRSEGRTQERERVRLKGSAPARFQLWDAAEVRGTVVDEHGEPVADVLVFAGYDVSRLFALDPADSARTDADGAFGLRGVPLGWVWLRAWHPERGLLERELRLSGPANDLRLELSPQPSVAIDVAISGLAAEQEASARFIPYRDGHAQAFPLELRRAETVDGHAVFRGLLPGLEYAFRGSSTGLVEPDRVKISPDQAQPGATLAIEFESRSVDVQRIHGALVDTDGKPIAGQVLSAYDTLRSRIESATDDAGRFALQGHFATGMDATLRLEGKAYVPFQPGNSRPSYWRIRVDPDTVLQISAIRSATLSGRIVDDRGEGVVGADVILQYRHPGRMSPWGPAQSGISGRDGSFRFEGLRPGVKTRVSTGWHALDDAPATEAFTLKAADQIEDLTLVEPSPTFVEGRLVDAAGEPVAGARVWLRHWDMAKQQLASGDVNEVLTDRNGRFRFGKVAPGGYFLMWFTGWKSSRGAPGLRTEPFEVAAGETVSRELVDK